MFSSSTFIKIKKNQAFWSCTYKHPGLSFSSQLSFLLFIYSTRFSSFLLSFSNSLFSLVLSFSFLPKYPCGDSPAFHLLPCIYSSRAHFSIFLLSHFSFLSYFPFFSLLNTHVGTVLLFIWSNHNTTSTVNRISQGQWSYCVSRSGTIWSKSISQTMVV